VQNAIKFAGEVVSTSYLMDIIRRDKDYYIQSDGGVTFSGGEAFMQFNGLMELLTDCKKEGIHTAVETCGHVDPKRIKAAFPLIDLFLFDIKHTDKLLLKKETGADSELILGNLSYISELNSEKIIIRVPVLPGFNFNPKDIRSIFNLALDKKIKNVHLLPYHTLGKDKYDQLGLTYSFPHNKLLSKEELIPLKQIGEEMGLHIRIGG